MTTEYQITRADLDSITDVEMAFGTSRLLPPFELVPDEFKNGNAYTKLLSCIFYGDPLPEGEIDFRAGFEDDEAPQKLNRVVCAHLRSFDPKHEHKMAGLGYLMSLVCTLTSA